MEEKKVKITKELRELIKTRCDKNPIYSLLLFRITGNEKSKLSRTGIEIPIKDSCFLKVIFSMGTDKRKAEKYLFIKKKIDIFKGKDSYSKFEEKICGYESNGMLEQEIHRRSFSEALIENLIEKGVLDKDYETKMEIERCMNCANDILKHGNENFNKSETILDYINLFKIILNGFAINELEKIYANLEIYWYIDFFDWELIGLWQRFEDKQKEDFFKFMESLYFSSNEIHQWKCLECIKRKKQFALPPRTKNKIVKQIMQKVDVLISKSKNHYNSYTIMGFLIENIEFLIYLSKDDWTLLANLAKLETKENGKESLRRKQWCIKFAEGIIFENLNTMNWNILRNSISNWIEKT